MMRLSDCIPSRRLPQLCRLLLSGRNDASSQLFASLEMRCVFSWYGDWFACLRIASGTGRAIVETEAAESTDLYSMAMCQCLGDRIEDCIDRDFRILMDKVGKSIGQDADKI